MKMGLMIAVAFVVASSNAGAQALSVEELEGYKPSSSSPCATTIAGREVMLDEFVTKKDGYNATNPVVMIAFDDLDVRRNASATPLSGFDLGTGVRLSASGAIHTGRLVKQTGTRTYVVTGMGLLKDWWYDETMSLELRLDADEGLSGDRILLHSEDIQQDRSHLASALQCYRDQMIVGE